MAKLILIRHGQSIRNAGDTVQGSDPDPANILSEKGKEQAYALGDLMVRRGITPASVWSSPLPRARQTCDIVLGVMRCNLPVNEDPRLQEMCKGLRGLPGGLEGRKRQEAKTAEYREQYRRFGWDFRHGSRESGGETAREAGLRFLAIMHMIADGLAGNATGFVFAHGQVIRYGIGAAFGFTDIKSLDANYRLNNCESLIVGRSAIKQWQLMGRMAAS
jgi:broad specificity phosphatase PhoE